MKALIPLLLLLGACASAPDATTTIGFEASLWT